MAKPKITKKGIILLIVLGTILMVILLATVLLTTITSQARLTAHQLGRVQAYYASMAGINLAYDRLMAVSGGAAWPVPLPASAPYYRAICRAAGFTPQGIPCTVVDANFPNKIPYVLIAVAPIGQANFSVGVAPNQVDFPSCVTSSAACISAYVNYTYTP